MVQEEGASDLARIRAMVTGALGQVWRAQADAASTLFTKVWGDAQPRVRGLPPVRRGPLSTAIGVPARRDAERTAVEAIQAFYAADIDGLIKKLARRCWILWPNGDFGYFARHAIHRELKGREARPLKVQLKGVRAYTIGDLKALATRGVAEGMQSLLKNEKALVVRAQLKEPSGALGTVMLLLSHDALAGWQSVTLPLPSLVESVCVSEPVGSSDDSKERVFRSTAQHFLQGHARALHSMVDDLMPVVALDGTQKTRAEMVSLAALGPDRMSEADLLFLGLGRVSRKDREAIASRFFPFSRTAP